MKNLIISIVAIALIVFLAIGLFEYSKHVVRAEYEQKIDAKNLAIDSIRNVLLDEKEKLHEYKLAFDSLNAHHNKEIDNLPNLDYHDLYIKYWVDKK